MANKVDNVRMDDDTQKVVKVGNDISRIDDDTDKAVKVNAYTSHTDSDFEKNVADNADNSRFNGDIEKSAKVKANNSKIDGDTEKVVRVKADNTRIDGDIEKAVKVKLSSEIAEDEGVSNELYANLYSWLCCAIQQERNHWKRQADAMLQALNRNHREALTHQTKLQKLINKLDPHKKQTTQNDQNGYKEDDFEEKEVATTEKLLEELEAKLDAILDRVEGGIKSKTNSSHISWNFSNSQQTKSTKPKPDGKSICLAEGGIQEAHGFTPQTLEHTADNKRDNQVVAGKMSSVPLHALNTNSQLDNNLISGDDFVSQTVWKDPIKIPKEEQSPLTLHSWENDGEPPLGLSSPESHEEHNEDGRMEHSGCKAKPIKCEPQGRVVPISNCQVWSSIQRGTDHSKPATHPYLKRSSPAQPKETFSIKKMTSLSQDERQKYEKAIQSKKSEIKYVKSDLEEALDQIQKLQKVIQRLYILNRHLKETPGRTKDESGTIKDTSDDEKDVKRNNKHNTPRNKKDIPGHVYALSLDGKKTERKLISKSTPNLNTLPVFQAMPSAEMALWKLRVKQRNIQGKRTQVAQCLRCQRLFRPEENNNISCRYHRNGQQTVEKYDAKGKLVRVIYKWACCQREVDAPGCTHSQHI